MDRKLETMQAAVNLLGVNFSKGGAYPLPVRLQGGMDQAETSMRHIAQQDGFELTPDLVEGMSIALGGIFGTLFENAKRQGLPQNAETDSAILQAGLKIGGYLVYRFASQILEGGINEEALEELYRSGEAPDQGGLKEGPETPDLSDPALD